MNPHGPAARVLTVVCLSAVVVVFAIVIVRTAWVSDDAYITFRTVDNFLHGYGLRWNIAERVQSYTHPLWLILLTPAVYLTGNPYLSALALSAVLTACTIALVLVSSGGRPWQAGLALTSMTLSRAFTDYSTSGLENALSHALLALLMLSSVSPIDRSRRAAAVGGLVGLAGLTRLDLLLLALPIGAASFRTFRVVPAFLAGALPLVIWEAFSLVYYGVPFPNTAYAKLATGIPRSELLVQGASYVLDGLNRDPITVFVIAAGVVGTFLSGQIVFRPAAVVPAVSVISYVAYVVWIGGDFMSGRFLTAPFVVSLFLLIRLPWPESLVGRLAPLGAALALGLSAANPTLLSGSSYHTPWTEVFSPTGIADERGYYFRHSGWLTSAGFRWGPGNLEDLQRRLGRVLEAQPHAFPHDTVGMVGYLTGRDRHIVDVLALNDPLLARLPAERPWRIGHYERQMPAGYFESVVENRNVIEDPRIASLYEVIREATRGPIWSRRRWKAIVALNTGRTEGWTPSR